MTVNIVDPETGRIRVMSEKCETCIFRPGNLMDLRQGRLQDMLDVCEEVEGHIPCHQTLPYYDGSSDLQAICRGFADHPAASERSLALRIAHAQGGPLYV